MIFIALILLVFFVLIAKCLPESIRPFSLTLRELIITIFCSITPIILDSLVKALISEETFDHAFYGSFKSGQMFLYTSAFLSAFFVLYMKDGSSKPPLLILLALIYCWVAGALIYSLIYMGSTLNIKIHIADNKLALIETSIFIGVFLVWFWSTYPNHKEANSGAKAAQSQQEELNKKFRSNQAGGKA